MNPSAIATRLELVFCKMSTILAFPSASMWSHDFMSWVIHTPNIHLHIYLDRSIESKLRYNHTHEHNDASNGMGDWIVHTNSPGILTTVHITVGIPSINGCRDALVDIERAGWRAHGITVSFNNAVQVGWVEH